MSSINLATLVELLRSRALHHPNQHAYTFLIDGEKEGAKWTYGTLDRHARAIGALLQSYHAHGERVLLLYPPGLEFIAAFFGSLYAGAIAVPAYPPRNKRYLPRIQTIVENAQARILLTVEHTQEKIQTWLDQASSLKSLQILSTDNLPEGMEKQWQEPNIDGTNLAFLQYTSGSTATPKGVMITHANLLHNLELIQEYFGHSLYSKGVIWLPPYHDMGLIGGILQPLFVGFPVILMAPAAFLQRPVRWLQAISTYRATTSGGPNFAYDLCVSKITADQLRTIDLSSWNLAFNGSEPVRFETLESFAAAFEFCGFRQEAFYPCYGLAEATLFVTGGKKSELPVNRTFYATEIEHNRAIEAPKQEEKVRRLVGCGQNLRDQTIVIVDPETRTRCSPDHIGEIWITGPGVAQGYWNQPDITKESFQAYLEDSKEGPFLRTGDLGFMKDGELFITGRRKDLIIIRGRNYYPQDIEWTIEQSHPAIRRNCSAAFSVDINGEERLVIVAEVERRYMANRRQSDEKSYEGVNQRQFPGLNQQEIEPGFSRSIQQPPDIDVSITHIRQAVAEEYDLDAYAILLIKATTIPRTSSGKIQRHLCKTGFLNDSLEIIGKWVETPIEDKVLIRLDEDTSETQDVRDQSAPKPPSRKLSLSTETIQAWLIAKLSESLGVRPHEIDIREPFARYGLDSVKAVRLSADLEDWLGCKLSPTLVYDYPNIAVLSQYLALSSEISDISAKIQTVRKVEAETIAIIGLGCRFPGAKDPDAFWELLHKGVDAITEVPPDRWDVTAFYDPIPATPGKMNTRWGGFLEHVDFFDPQFFGISPREAETMDPQQRLLLEVAWEALENSGHAPDLLTGSYTGVFIGISNYDYVRVQNYRNADAYTGTGNALSIAANRLSYFLNLRGPSIAIDTACSSALVAIHQACLSLRQRECDLALAGGVNLILIPDTTISLSQSQMMASDGRCKAFDARADGYVRGEGCGIVVLKRLSDALRDSDNILTLIRGSAVNQDGRSNGLTAPNGFAQQAVIYQALENAGISPTQISYFEAHGTGTALGDPIEVNALKEVLMSGRSPEHPCWIGSVKTNIGHLEAASGVAGLIKVVLALQHKEIPPNLHLTQLNPHISFEGTPFAIPTEPQKWIVGKDRRIAGVNSFGFGGTNAHIVVEETLAKATMVSEVDRPIHILTLSARSENALEELMRRYEAYLRSHPQVSLPDVCFTANVGRTYFDHRLAVITESLEQLREQLEAFGKESEAAGVLRGKVRSGSSPKIAFLFTGQGSQYSGMGRQLYETQPRFRRTLDYCDTILRSYLEKPLLEVLYPKIDDCQLKIENSQSSIFNLQSSILNETAYTQPALFALEYTLADLWMSWGIIPTAVIGHSIGEYAAACIARVFSLEDGLKLIAERARLMQALPKNGKMAAVFAEQSQVAEAIHPYAQDVSISAINGPKTVVISGKSEAVEAVTTVLHAEGIKTKELQVSHAFHSPLMEPMLPAFAEAAQKVTFVSPQIDIICNLTGQLNAEMITTVEYWTRHIRQTVQFAAGMETLYQQGYEMFIEVGPNPTLAGLGRQIVEDIKQKAGSSKQKEERMETSGEFWLPSLRQGRSDWRQLLQSLGELYVCGIPVDWVNFDQYYLRHRVALPSYPFQRQRYWVKTDSNILPSRKGGIHKAKIHPLLGQRLNSALKEVQFESQISQRMPVFLGHHRIFQTPILPATTYIEMALAAGSAIFKSDHLVIEQVVIQQALILPENEEKTIQVILTPEGTRSASFQIFSLVTNEENEEPPWTLHVSGKVFVEDTVHEPPQVELTTLKTQVCQEISVEDIYRQYQERGIEYGPSFKAITHLWRDGGEILGQIRLPDIVMSETEDYKLHPALLDACLQTLGVTIPQDDRKDVYLPMSLERLRLYRRPGTHLWSHARVNPVTDMDHQILTADLDIFDETGTMVAQLEGLSLRQASRDVLLRSIPRHLDDWLYEIVWRPKPLKSEDWRLSIDACRLNQSSIINHQSPIQKGGSWFIFADKEILGLKLVQLLKNSGKRCVVVLPHQDYQKVTEVFYTINPTQPYDFQRFFRDSAGESYPSCQGIVHLWGVEPTQEPTLETLQQSQVFGCESVLHLVQALMRTGWSTFPRLWLVTRGTQPVGAYPAPLNVQQAPLWGFSRVIALEHPELLCTHIDLDYLKNLAEIQTLFEELWSPDNETQVAYRQGVRHVARLVRRASKTLEKQSQRSLPKAGPLHLKMSSYGILENLTLEPMVRRQPEVGEVEIEVHASGLNFRDVLHALGMLQEPAEKLGITSAADMPFGFECSGKIVSVGENVTDLRVGDDVIAALAIGSMSSFVTVRAEYVVRKPPELSLEEAATLPITFLTACYGLCHLAKVGSGDRVLIHAAAGGVGQAAVQLAQRAGAEVFATASPGKWKFLKSIGVQHVMNSRTLDFAKEVMDLTNGQGVNIVLNSLSGEFIPKTLEILGEHGRFVEIGKIGIWTETQMKACRPDVSYFPFDLGEVAQHNPDLITSILKEVIQGFQEKALKPLPYTVFPIQDAASAFRYMAQAKHIGKVVVNCQLKIENCQSSTFNLQSSIFNPNASYLITGGLGALGLKLAQWMVEQGAKHLMLAGRRGAVSEAAQQVVKQLGQAGARISVIKADVSDQEEMSKIMEEMTTAQPSLRGIVHAAGVLDDDLLTHQTWERFKKVMAPKVEGTWNLHILTRDMPLDFFVCFSSVVSMLGSPGQGSYAAANAFMDALMHHRRALGLPGLSINWGPWADSGMVATLSRETQARWAAQGLSTILPEQGLQVLEALMAQDAAQVGVWLVTWSKFIRQFPKNMELSYLEAFRQTAEQPIPPQSVFLQQLKEVPSNERRDLLMSHLRLQLSKVLGLTSPEQIEPRQRVFDMGLDSLMAIELKNRLEVTLGCSLRSTLLFDYPTLEVLVDYLLQEVFSVKLPAEPATKPQDTQDETEAKLTELDELSEDEVGALLDEKLANIDIEEEE
jgi:phthiocerol/phenolphthiocerol synthesis type-I polyketide synthase C